MTIGAIGRAVADPYSGLNAYSANLHSHTDYSDSAAATHDDTPWDALLEGWRNGLKVMAVSDHGGHLNQLEWDRTADQVNRANLELPPMVSLRGFEWTGAQGHINVFGSNSYTDVKTFKRGAKQGTLYDPNRGEVSDLRPSLSDLYSWIGENSSGALGSIVCQFNHPNSYSSNPFNFDSQSPPDQVKELFALIELAGFSPDWQEFEHPIGSEIGPETRFNDELNVGIWQQALRRRWKLAPAFNEDNHTDDYGNKTDRGQTGIWATSLTPANIMEAFRLRRVFATQVPGLSLKFWAEANTGTAMMGGAVTADGALVRFHVEVNGSPTTVSHVKVLPIQERGELPQEGYTFAAMNESNGSYYQDVLPTTDIICYYARVYLSNNKLAYSAPIWINFPPTPPATPINLTAAPGNARVSLSWVGSPGAASYNIKRSITSGGPYTTIKTGVSGWGYVDTNVSNGTTYYYVVSAVSNTGTETANSNQASATPAPGVYTWTGASTTDPTYWYDRSNWTPIGIPGPGDTAIINSGTVNLTGSVAVANLNLISGTLDGSGTVTVSGVCNWTGGAIDGTLNIPVGGQLNISGDGLYYSGPYKFLRGTLNNAGTATVTGTGPVYFYREASGATYLGTFNNSGTCTVQSDTAFDIHPNWGGTAIFNNSGTLTKSASTGTTYFGGYHSSTALAFNNSGTVNANSGTLSLTSGGTSNGTFNANSGATLICSGTLAARLNAASGSLIQLTNGTLNTGTICAGAGLCDVIGAVTLNGTVTVNGTFQVNGGTLTGTNTGGFNGSGTVNFKSGSIAGTVNIPASSPSIPTCNWTGGAIDGTLNIPVGGQLNISGDGLYYSGPYKFL
ncbi:MAG: CehA/McbA family metallohydrolase, partial [Armatimonadota bacterium]|nr:CehA/McbA family metallohydrolase [Armatimonadota bacterium]